MKRLFLSIGLFSLLLAPLSCTKVLVHGRDKEMEPVSKLYSTSVDDAYKTAREAVVRLGYRIERDDSQTHTLLTNWLPTKALSHYVELFDREDYGTVGAYYRLKVKVEDRVAGDVAVEVNSITRSIITRRLQTSYREENKVLGKVADLLRTDEFSITNVGVEEK